MFTGIIEEMGELARIRRGGKSVELTISCKKVMEGLQVGDSVATNGVCLTVTRMEGQSFSVDVIHESLSRSGLGDLQIGDPVNLERAMPASGRFDGHIVSGHIDGQGTVLKTWGDDNAVWFRVECPAPLMKWIVEKGSIAMDGVSLTVAEVEGDTFSVSIIPHTLQETVLKFKKAGSKVNLECDILGKYVEKLLLSREEENQPGLSLDDLRQNGFL